MSEELPTGSDFTLANAGLTPAPIAPETPEPETFGPGIEGVREAANQLSRERPAPGSEEPIKRTLEWRTGSRAGQTVDLQKERYSLTPEAAAKTLSQVHREEDAIEANANLQALAADVDATRAWAAGQQQPDPQQQPAQAEAPQQPSEAPQPEASASEQPSGLGPKLQAALQDPEIRQAFEAPYQAAAQVQQAYTQATAQIAETAAAGLLAQFSELQGLNSQQLPVALQLIQRQNPQRHAEIVNHLQHVDGLYRTAQQAQAQQAQINQEQYKQWAAAQDKALEAKVPEIANDVDMKVSRAALKSSQGRWF